MIGCKVMRTLASVEIEIMSILGLPCCLSSSSVRCLESVSKIATGSDDWLIDVGHACLSVVRVAFIILWIVVGSDMIWDYAFVDYVFYVLTSCACEVSNMVVFVDPKSSTQADGAQSSRVPVPLPGDPFKAIRQAYLDGTDIKSEPFEDPIDTETPESPLTIAPPTSLPKSTPPTLVPILRRTTHMAVRVPPAMSSGLSASMAEVAAMSESAFRKRFRSFYESSPSLSPLDLPSWKHYREDEGPTAEDEDPAAGDEGLAAGVEGPEEEEAVPGGQQQAALVVRTSVSAPLGFRYEALRRRELALEEDHVYSTFEVRQGFGFAPEFERPERVLASRQPTLTTWTDLEDGMVYIDLPAYPPPVPHVQTPSSPEWTSGLLPISPSPSVVPSHVSSPMIPLTVPSPVSTPTTAETEGFLTKRELMSRCKGIDSRSCSTIGGAIACSIRERHVLALKAWAGHVDTRITDMSWARYDDHMIVHDMLLHQTALQRELQEMRGRVTAL
nr:hypothetical protein [Tanacetum cinerariifolium]